MRYWFQFIFKINCMLFDLLVRIFIHSFALRSRIFLIGLNRFIILHFIINHLILIYYLQFNYYYYYYYLIFYKNHLII